MSYYAPMRTQSLIPVATLVLAVLGGGLAGCDSKLSPTEIVAGLSQKLNVPVFLWAYPDDYCVEQQVSSLYQEFKDLRKKDKKAVVQALRSYDSIVIETAAYLGTYNGTVKDVQLVDQICKANQRACRTEIRKQKRVSDDRTLSASAQVLGTVVTRGPSLLVRPSVAANHGVRRVFQTTQTAAYDDLISGNYKDPETALAYRSDVALVLDEKSAGTAICGKLATLKDLLP
jgi:hypothetical protein